ncbi:type II secretion system minor pseudopilin GspK [soil metagenome]
MKALRHRESGVAVITALLIVALATLAVTGIMLRQQVQARSVENQMSLAQSRWLARGATDWARVMLIADGRTTSYDHNTDNWAIPVAETRVANADGGSDRGAYLSGRITDEQGKFNLLGLLGDNGQDLAQVARAKRLFASLSIDPSAVDVLVKALLETRAQRVLGDNNEVKQTIAAKRLPWLLIEDLRQLPQIDADAVERLRPHAAFLPRNADGTNPKVNANTATAEVLHATIDGMSMSQAEQFVTQRDRIPLLSEGDIQNRLNTLRIDQPATQAGLLDVKSSFFRVQGRIRYERAFLSVEALVLRVRAGASTNTRVLWTRES